MLNLLIALGERGRGGGVSRGWEGGQKGDRARKEGDQNQTLGRETRVILLQSGGVTQQLKGLHKARIFNDGNDSWLINRSSFSGSLATMNTTNPLCLSYCLLNNISQKCKGNMTTLFVSWRVCYRVSTD